MGSRWKVFAWRITVARAVDNYICATSTRKRCAGGVSESGLGMDVGAPRVPRSLSPIHLGARVGDNSTNSDDGRIYNLVWASDGKTGVAVA